MRWTALAVAIVATAALLWIGGEQHYQSCVEAARLGYTTPSDPVERLTYDSPSIKHCSRLPF